MMSIDGVRHVVRSEEYLKQLQKQQNKGLARLGGYVRTIAKRSIRKRKGASAPGNPPHSHNGLLKREIWFWLNYKDQYVDVGPAALGGTQSKDIPGILEKGGKFEGDKIKPRPYMGPAFENKNAQDKMRELLNA